jgi:hypothetical protein
MHPLTGQLAAVMASTDGVPRLVRQYDDCFLVTPQGAIWRIFDSADPDGETRCSPSTDPGALTRIFIGGGVKPTRRVYTFLSGEPRTIGAERLNEQLLAARPTGQ